MGTVKSRHTFAAQDSARYWSQLRPESGASTDEYICLTDACDPFLAPLPVIVLPRRVPSGRRSGNIPMKGRQSADLWLRYDYACPCCEIPHPRAKPYKLRPPRTVEIVCRQNSALDILPNAKRGYSEVSLRSLAWPPQVWPAPSRDSM